MKLRKICKNKLAFTLVELVVVIAIMAILAGAVAGAVVGVRASANKSEVTDTGAKLADQLQLMVANGDISNSMTQDNLKKALEAQLPGVEYVTKATTAQDGKKYIQIPTKPAAGWLKASSTFIVYTSKYTMNVTLDGTTGAVTKGDATSV